MLLQGETGTGKQVLARAIHSLDQKRCHFAFVTVHCSTVTETLAESELFGHRKGSFSLKQMVRDHIAQGSSLFVEPARFSTPTVSAAVIST